MNAIPPDILDSQSQLHYCLLHAMLAIGEHAGMCYHLVVGYASAWGAYATPIALDQDTRKL